VRQTAVGFLVAALLGVVVPSAQAAESPAVPDIIGGCPTQPVTGVSVHSHPRRAAGRAAVTYATGVLGWQKAQVSETYRVGSTSRSFDLVFAKQIPMWCGRKVARASFGVELSNPLDAVAGTSSRAALVVAPFADGWRVWGRFHF
jgi:hypothetical protein